MNAVMTADDSGEAARRKLGQDIAFGMQQTFACWATDFIDPYVGKAVQKRFEDDRHQGTLKHTWGGEIIGDSAAFFTFLGVQRFAPGVTRGFKKLARSTMGGVFERTGRKHLRHWAEKEGVSEKSPEYQQKMEEWKEFQADNASKAAVISVSSIAANVATQKAMGNTHKLPIILAGKVIGAAITLATMLGLRFAIPKTTRQLDEELSDEYFSPLIRKTQKLFGVEVSEKPQKHPAKSHARREADRRHDGTSPNRAR